MAHMSLDFKSTSLTRNVSMEVFLPCNEGFPVDSGPFKTLYFLPGFSSSSKELATYMGFRLQSALNNLAIVIVDGDNSFYINHQDGFSNYSDYICNELLTFTRSILPLSDKREDTFIGGISMGGYGALINGIKASDKFSKIVAMSPGVDLYDLQERSDTPFTEDLLQSLFGSKDKYIHSDLDNNQAILDAVKDHKEIPDLFICCGTEDKLVGPNVSHYINFLKQQQIPYVYKTNSGGHDPIFWEKMLPEAIDFLIK